MSSASQPLTERVRARLPVRIRVPLRLARDALVTWNDLRYVGPTLKRTLPYSMVGDAALILLGKLVRRVLADRVPGAFVECGVWRGGAAFLMADLLRRARIADRKVWLFDSFEGMPAPEDVDGDAAERYMQATGSPWYRDNCRASVEEVRQTAQKLGLAPYTELVKGWFEQSLPTHSPLIGPISLLRLDCDWYRSVRCCLDHLYDQVSPGGIVLFDDYYAYDGCALAVHEFLAERRLPHRLENVASNVYFRKV